MMDKNIIYSESLSTDLNVLSYIYVYCRLRDDGLKFFDHRGRLDDLVGGDVIIRTALKYFRELENYECCTVLHELEKEYAKTFPPFRLLEFEE